MRKTISRRGRERSPCGVHLALWVETAPVGKPGRTGSPGVRPVARRAWPIACLEDRVAMAGATDYSRPRELLWLLTQGRKRTTPLTVWVARGWESLCMTGLADLIERGDITYHRLTLDGERVVLKGKVGKLPLTITSLTSWTGGAWDEWRGKCEPAVEVKHRTGDNAKVCAQIDGAGPGERVLLGTVATVLRSCQALCLGPPAASLGAMARRWWNLWGGRTLRDNAEPTVKRPPPGKRRPVRIVCPVPRRPRVAGQAEAHVAHGLVREQYCRGESDGPIHVVDLSQAYLLALAVATLPAVYEKTVASMHPAQLARWVNSNEAVALCRLAGTGLPVVQWRDRKPRRLVGSFWAWLSGADLLVQLGAGAVAEVHTAHLWRGIRHTPMSRAALLNVGPQLRESEGEWAMPFWRGLYSALPGSWAQSVYRWEDTRQEFRSGRWATFVMAGAVPGTVDHYRVVGGRVQRRVCRGEAPHALPLAYASVTSCVREQVDFLRAALPTGTVLATACDSLWVTDAGLAALRGRQNRGAVEGSAWAVKATWDRVWLDGRGGAVGQRGGEFYPLTAGVPQSARLGPDGKARWSRAEPWCASVSSEPDAKRMRAHAKWDGGKLVDENRRPLEFFTPWLRVEENALSESLLLPFNPVTTGATDDSEVDL